ncbi:Glycine/D-amino acid oxidase [Algoriphagus faecimaris]|uniref:Glycine/D-amino acid oxidase n=1 Tax=Algoriphagus faecimaris TaxID=686796 RepID=A0A1G6RCQ6_9BACT|nr:FAD-dependent oxidoreductase [Algoriphagus faecimaris]SDD02409.1 Glycine/D-amino acid oxidase [Algoriphagus faecimaris]
MFSYWEKKNFLKYDFIVIGAGFVGLSTAIHWSRKFPKSKVLILERGIFPNGASTKNAGFACFGSLTELLDDFWQMTPPEVLDLVKRRYKGLESIRKEFGDRTIDYRPSKGFELIDASQLDALDRIDEINGFLKPIFKKPVFSLVPKRSRFGFSEKIKEIVQNQYEGELDPGKYVEALWKEASRLGIKILTGVEVLSIDQDEGKLLAKNSFSEERIPFEAEKIAICTNAFAKNLIPDLDLEPGRGLVMTTKELDFKIPWKGSFHMDQGYVYFRKVGNRLLIGGARNLDKETEQTLSNEINPKIKSHLIQLAEEIIFPGKSLEWDLEWTGIMAFGPKKVPIIQEIGKRTFLAARLGGMGVAVGWQVGKELSTLIRKRN